jgi:hypothetical protein
MHDAAVNLKSKDTYYFAVRLPVKPYSEFDKQLHRPPHSAAGLGRGARSRARASRLRAGPCGSPRRGQPSKQYSLRSLTAAGVHSGAPSSHGRRCGTSLSAPAVAGCAVSRKDVGIALTSPLVSSSASYASKCLRDQLLRNSSEPSTGGPAMRTPKAAKT